MIQMLKFKISILRLKKKIFFNIKFENSNIQPRKSTFEDGKINLKVKSNLKINLKTNFPICFKKLFVENFKIKIGISKIFVGKSNLKV